MLRTVLPSGVHVVSERVEGQRSVVSGVWVRTGSRDEPADLRGVTHLLEHLVFKGTPRRSALAIAEAFDAIGGDLNAYTTKEFTCFHARTLGEDLQLAVETMADIVTAPSLAAVDLEAERPVVLEEIAMHEDTPDDLVFDVLSESMWGSHPLAVRVQGTHGSVAAATVEQIAAYHRARFVSPEIVVAAAGEVDHELLVRICEEAFTPGEAVARPRMAAPVTTARLTVVERDLEQVHLAYGTDGLSRRDERRWALGVLNIVLGAGMSSRLFQKIREERGLAYAVSSGHQGFAEAGQFSIYAGCSAENASAVLQIAREQIDDLLDRGATPQEVARAKGHMRGTLAISMDDPGAVMSHIGKSELLMDAVLTVDEMMERIDAVTVEQVHDVARTVLGAGPWSLAVVGPRVGADVSRFVQEAA